MRRPHVSRSEIGEGKLLNLVWLAIFLSAVYFGTMYIPVYSEKWSVKSLLQDIGNQNWLNFDQDKVKAAIIARVNEEYNKDGKNFFILDTENIVIDKNETTKMLTLRITWTRVIPYPFLNKQTQKIFSAQYAVDTHPVKY